MIPNSKRIQTYEKIGDGPPNRDTYLIRNNISGVVKEIPAKEVLKSGMKKAFDEHA